MASIKTHIIVRLLTLWNYLHNLYTDYKKECNYFYKYIKNYFIGYHDMWVWQPHTTYPISLDKVDNDSIYIDWFYNNHTKLLDYYGNDTDNEVLCKFSWLSASIHIIDANVLPFKRYEFNIDDFIENFRIKTTPGDVPTLVTVFLSWCIHNKHWFSGSSFVEFNIIDDFGDLVKINLCDHNRCLEIKENKIRVVVHNSTENDDTSRLNITEDEPDKHKDD